MIDTTLKARNIIPGMRLCTAVLVLIRTYDSRQSMHSYSDIVMIVSKGVGQSGSRMCALRCIISSIIVPVDDSKPYRRTVMTHDIICYACAKKYSSSILGRVHIYKTGGTTNCSCIKKHHSASVRDSNRVAPIS